MNKQKLQKLSELLRDYRQSLLDDFSDSARIIKSSITTLLLFLPKPEHGGFCE